MWKKRDLNEKQFWQMVHAHAKAHSKETSGADMVAGLSLLDSKLASRLADEAIFLLIEDMDARRSQPGMIAAKGKLHAEQHRRAEARHTALTRLAWATLMVAALTLAATIATLFR